MRHKDFISHLVYDWLKLNTSVVSETPRTLGNEIEAESPHLGRSTGMSSVTFSAETSARKKRSRSSDDDGTRKRKCSTITSSSLEPNGDLGCRLSRSYKHFPEHTPTKDPNCQLHLYLSGIRVRGNEVCYCADCNVNLCVSCWKRFHEEEQLLKKV